MTNRHQITVNGHSFTARHGERLLDAALAHRINLPYECRAGHCGTCCVRLISGKVRGGEGTEPGIIHACQGRIIGDAVFEKRDTLDVRTISGVVSSLQALSRDVIEVAITTERALPHHAGQYAQARFDGYPSRPYSMTLPLSPSAPRGAVIFHIRRWRDGRVTSALGTKIRNGHPVMLTGPFGAAHFRPGLNRRLVLVATNTGFAPIWAIAAAALRERPERRMMVIAGGRSLASLYMGPALAQLARFPNVLVVPVCSGEPAPPAPILPGRPTDFMPELLASDVLYACGAEGMVAEVKAMATRSGATCYADPFLPAENGENDAGVLSRAIGWLAVPPPRATRYRERTPANLALRLPAVSATTTPAKSRPDFGPQSI